MTSSTAKIQAASNGGTTTEHAAQETPAEPSYGFARLRETEVYHLTSLAQSALTEAEHVIRAIHDKARERWLDHDGDTEPLDVQEITRLLSDAYQCATKAATVIDEAAMHWLDSDLPEEPITLR